MAFQKSRNGLVLKSSRSSFDNLGSLSGRRSLSFNVEKVGRNSPINTPKVVEDVEPGSVALQNVAEEVQPQNKKGRFRFGFPNIRIPFLGRKKSKNNGPESLGKCISNPLPMNRANPDKNSALLRFDTYDAAEFALKEMAVNAQFENSEWSQNGCPLALWSGSTWDHNLFLPPVPSMVSTFISLSDEECFYNSPRDDAQKDWLSSPETEIDNEWRRDRKCSVGRRPSSAYGAVGNSSRLDRDSASRYATKKPYRKGIDGGSRAEALSSAEMPGPVCAETTDAACSDHGTTKPQMTVPTLALDNLTLKACEPQPGVRTNESRVRGAFGSTIPVLEEFAGDQLKSPVCEPLQRHNEEIHESDLYTGPPSTQSRTSDEVSDLDDLESLDDLEELDSVESLCQSHTREEPLDPWLLQGHSCPDALQSSGHEDCAVSLWDLDEVTAEYLQCRNKTFVAPCLTAHPDEPDHATEYPASVSSEEADDSLVEHTLADFPCSLSNKPKKTVLDVLEHREELKRKEILGRIYYQKSLIKRMKSQVHKSKVAFDRLRQGLGPQLTEKVQKLRQRWGSGLRIRRQKRIEKIKNQDEEDLWDMHFNEADCVFASDAESWVTDDGELVDC